MNLESIPLLIKISLLIVLVIAVSAVVAWVTRKKLTKQRRRRYAIIGALILTSVTFLFLLGHSRLFQQEAILSAKLGKLRKEILSILPVAAPVLGADSDFVDSSFLFISVKDQVKIIPHPKEFVEYGAKSVVTDRNKLTKLLAFLHERQSQFDLLVCDLLFPEVTSDDKALHQAIRLFQDSNKLALAYDRDIEKRNPEIYQELNNALFGYVSNVEDEPVYYSNDIVKEMNGVEINSLAYQMFMKISPNTNINPSRYTFNNNITEFNFTDEDRMYHLPKDTIIKQSQTTKVNYQLGHDNMFSLGEFSDEYGKNDFLEKLQQKHKTRKKIIYIGNMTDDFLDKHETSAGVLRGTTLIINEFYYFYQGYHFMSYFKLACFLLAIALWFYVILCAVLNAADKKDSRTSRDPLPRPQHFLDEFFAWGIAVFAFIFEELHLLMLLMMVFVIDISFHKAINIIGLIYLLPLFAALLSFFVQRGNRRRLAVNNV